MINNIFSKKKILLIFIAYSFLYTLIILLELKFLYSEKTYIQSLSSIYSLDEIYAIFSFDKHHDWINFIIIPLYIFVISGITAVIFNIFKFLFNINIGFGHFFYIAIFAHIVYVIFYFLNVIIRCFSNFNLINGEIDYFSLLPYIHNDIHIIYQNLLHIFDLCTIIYILFLSYVIHVFEKINFKKSLIYVTTSISISFSLYALVLSIFKLLII